MHFKKVPKTPELFEEKNITASIYDAYLVASWLDELVQWVEPVEPAGTTSKQGR